MNINKRYHLETDEIKKSKLSIEKYKKIKQLYQSGEAHLIKPLKPECNAFEWIENNKVERCHLPYAICSFIKYP